MIHVCYIHFVHLKLRRAHTLYVVLMLLQMKKSIRRTDSKILKIEDIVLHITFLSTFLYFQNVWLIHNYPVLRREWNDCTMLWHSLIPIPQYDQCGLIWPTTKLYESPAHRDHKASYWYVLASCRRIWAETVRDSMRVVFVACNQMILGLIRFNLKPKHYFWLHWKVLNGSTDYSYSVYLLHWLKMTRHHNAGCCKWSFFVQKYIDSFFHPAD